MVYQSEKKMKEEEDEEEEDGNNERMFILICVCVFMSGFLADLLTAFSFSVLIAEGSWKKTTVPSQKLNPTPCRMKFAIG